MDSTFMKITLQTHWRIQNFPRRGSQPPAKGGGWVGQHLISTKVSEKLHEIEKILVQRGAGAPLDPLMKLFQLVALNSVKFFRILFTDISDFKDNFLGKWSFDPMYYIYLCKRQPKSRQVKMWMFEFTEFLFSLRKSPF